MRSPRLLAVCFASLPYAAAQDHDIASVGSSPDADDPTIAAWTVDGQSLVILHERTDDLAFLDAGTLVVTDLVDVGEEPVDLELSPDGRYALVPDSQGNALVVVDVPTRSVVASVPLTGARPYAVEVASDSSIAVVACFGPDPSGSSVSVVDLATLQESSWFGAPDQAPAMFDGTPEPLGIELAGDDRTLLLPLVDVLRLDAYDVLSGSRTGAFTTPDPFLAPLAALSNPAGTRAAVLMRTFVGGYFEVYTIDLATMDGRPAGLHFGDYAMPSVRAFALTPDGSEALVVAESLHFVDMTNAAVTSLANTPGEALAITSDGSTVIVAPFRTLDRPLRAVDIATKTRLPDSVPSQSGRSLAAHPLDTRMAVLENFVAESVSVVQLAGGQLVELGRVPTGPGVEGDGPTGIAIDPTSSFAVTANELSDNLTVVDLKLARPIAWLDVGDRPMDVLLFDDGATAVVWHADGTISVVDVGLGTVLASFPTDTRGHVGSIWDGGPARMTRVAADRVMLYWDRRAVLVEVAGAASRVLRRVDIPSGPPSDHPRLASPSGLVGFSQGTPHHSFLLVDGSTLDMLDAIPTVLNPQFVELTESFAYVAGGAEIQRVDISGTPKKKGKVSVNYNRALRIDESAGYGYVGRWSKFAPPLDVVVFDVDPMQVVKEIPLPAAAVDLELAPPHLFVALRDGTLQRYRADGPNTVLLSEHPTRGEPIDMLVGQDGRTVLLLKRGVDQVDVFEF